MNMLIFLTLMQNLKSCRVGKDHGYRAVDEESSSGVQIKKFSAI